MKPLFFLAISNVSAHGGLAYKTYKAPATLGSDFQSLESYVSVQNFSPKIVPKSSP